MLSSVLRSDRAIQVNLARKLESLEKKYDANFRIVFDAIREMMDEKKKPRREIGFHTLMAKPAKAGGSKAKKI